MAEQCYYIENENHGCNGLLNSPLCSEPKRSIDGQGPTDR